MKDIQSKRISKGNISFINIPINDIFNRARASIEVK